MISDSVMSNTQVLSFRSFGDGLGGYGARRLDPFDGEPKTRRGAFPWGTLECQPATVPLDKRLCQREA